MKEFYFNVGGKKELDYEAAVSHLIDSCVLFVGEAQVQNELNIILYVLINDVFVPASDSLGISYAELPELFELYLKHSDSGTIIWAARKLKLQPRKRIKEAMQKEGTWSDELEQFTPNKY